MDPTAAYTEDSMWNGTTSSEPTLEHIYTSWVHIIIIASLTILIGILGIIGNFFIFLAVSISKSLQNSTNVFVVSLAVSDFISAVSFPFQGVSVLDETGWPFGKGMCDLLGVILIWTNSTSILTLTAIAVNRYIIITKSKRLQQRIFTRRGNAIIIALLWLFPFLVIGLPQLIPASGGIVYDPVFRSCLWDLGHPLAFIFQSIASVIFISCTLIIIFSYLAIYLFVRKHITRTSSHLKGSSNAMTIDADGNHQQRGPSVKQINITKNLALVVLVFFVCVLPYTLNLYAPSYGLHSAYLAVIVILPTCLNPLIYAARHPTFRAVFKCMFRCKLEAIPHQSDWLKAILHSTTSSTQISKHSSSVV